MDLFWVLPVEIMDKNSSRKGVATKEGKTKKCVRVQIDLGALLADIVEYTACNVVKSGMCGPQTGEIIIPEADYDRYRKAILKTFTRLFHKRPGYGLQVSRVSVNVEKE